MNESVKILKAHQTDFWMARAAVVVVAGLQLLASERVSVGPKLLAPGLELALLVPLSVGTALTHRSAREADSPAEAADVMRRARLMRLLSLSLTALVSLVNLGSLALLIRELLVGRGGEGPTLLLDATAIWLTNIIAFTLWFWSLDRQGAAIQSVGESGPPDFLFPQMLAEAQPSPDWRPRFIDYLYLAFTNATAFSPTDTMPLTGRAKLVMMLEASISLVTIAVVASRAVNILK